MLDSLTALRLTRTPDADAIDALRRDVALATAMYHAAFALAVELQRTVDKQARELSDARAAWARLMPERAPDE